MAVIASFVGTTPATPKEPVISAPSGVRAPDDGSGANPQDDEAKRCLEGSADDVAGALARGDQGDEGHQPDEIGRNAKDVFGDPAADQTT